jgi:hypothetical protein
MHCELSSANGSEISRVIDIQNARVNTAGAYVCLHGFYLFAMGTRLQHRCIPVIRLGGHREEKETGWQCAMREMFEEANLHIKPLMPADDLSHTNPLL